MKNRPLIFAIAIAFTLGVFPSPAAAYDNDTHFWFTYYLARKAGFTPIQATQIASADVSVDYDDDTQPVLPEITTFSAFRHPLDHFQYVRNRLHALPTKSEIIRLAGLPKGYWWDPVIITDPKALKVAHELVAERKREFWRDTISQGKNPGVFVHYLQDTFAHDGFASYVGHAGYYRIDFMASDTAKAERMAMTVLRYLVHFREVWFKTGDRLSTEIIADPSILEHLDLSKYLTPTDIADVKATVAKFAVANPSKGVTANDLVKEWDKLSDKLKRELENVPPPTFAKPTYEAAKEGPSPDSYRARAVVMGIFNLTDATAPYIWVYNLKDTGAIESDLANEAFIYKTRDIVGIRTSYTSDDEKGNKARKKIFDAANKRQCLPFKLVASTVTAVPYCK
jgi:hypothetical protein